MSSTIDFSVIEQLSREIVQMDEDSYDEAKVLHLVIECLDIQERDNKHNDEHINILYTTLTSKAGRILLDNNSAMALVAINKALGLVAQSYAYKYYDIRQTLLNFLYYFEYLADQHDISYDSLSNYNISLDKYYSDMKQVEKYRLRDDPFYQASIRWLNEKRSNDNTEKEKIKILRNIIRREMEKTCKNIDSCETYFKCDYDIAQLLTGVPVTNKITKKFGVDIKIEYDYDDVFVVVYDGTECHEFEFYELDIIGMMESIKKEIKKDTTQALYDSGFCRDVSEIISEYI